jgi:hypothetical protein
VALTKADVQHEQERGGEEGDGEERGEAPLKGIEFFSAEEHGRYPFLKDKQTLHLDLALCQVCLSIYELKMKKRC